MNHIMELEFVDSGGIYLYNKKKEELKLVYSSGISKAFAKSEEVYNKNSPQMKMVLRKKPIYGNYQEITKKNKTQTRGENFKLVAVFPLINAESDELIGCLNLASRKYERITERDKSDVESIAHSLVSLILYAQSQEKLKELNAQLEAKIKERTLSLEETNEKLSNEIKYHRETKDALIYSENLYRSIFENAQEGIALYDARSFQLVDINQKAHQDLGYSREEFIDLKPENYIVYDYSEQAQDFLKKIRRNKTVRYEIRLKSKNGDLKHFIISANLVNINNKKFIQGIFHNVTQLKQTEAKLKKANKQIVKINKNLEKRIERAVREQKLNQQYLIQKSKLESLGELAAGIAHEINQPLGVLALSHENLQMKIASKLATPDYLQNKFNSIEDNIGKIRQIIDHIRTFSRDQDLFAMEKVNLNKVVNKALSLIGTQYRNHNIHIMLDLNEEIGFTVGSNIQVEQVVLNLLSNAKYAVDEKATYMNEMEYTKEIIIRTDTSDKKVSLEIEDNGTGISVKDLPKIFDPFYTTKPEGFGTGVGLSIAYGIIRSMRGDIQADSKKDNYTKFEILFPRFPENN
ncbi:MAG: PAS domain S-box protein [Bacteroidales bacterium]|nr:PAS domain S-box protein [Bacteroidales bacterium]